MEYLKNKFIILGPFLGVLIAFRLALPFILLNFVENKLNEIPGYKAKIESIAVSLYRGSYQINQIRIDRINKNVPVPFFSAKKIDLSVEWGALLKGAFVAKVVAFEPNINFVTDPNVNKEQLTIDKRWQQIVKSLFPLNFNRVIVKNGSVHYQSFNKKSPFNIYLKKLESNLTNLNNADKSFSQLPSHLIVKGQTMNDAPVGLDLKFNPFSDNPTFNLQASLEKMKIIDTNNFLQYYTALRAKQGLFSLYIEAAAEKGKIRGYAKPIFKDLEIQGPASANPIKILYTAAASVASAVLKNRNTHAVATKIIVSGTIDDPDTSILSIIGYLFRNAFIQALVPGIDHNIPTKNIQFGKQFRTSGTSR
jgi:hypothetical protein